MEDIFLGGLGGGVSGTRGIVRGGGGVCILLLLGARQQWTQQRPNLRKQSI